MYIYIRLLIDSYFHSCRVHLSARGAVSPSSALAPRCHDHDDRCPLSLSPTNASWRVQLQQYPQPTTFPPLSLAISPQIVWRMYKHILVLVPVHSTRYRLWRHTRSGPLYEYSYIVRLSKGNNKVTKPTKNPKTRRNNRNAGESQGIAILSVLVSSSYGYLIVKIAIIVDRYVTHCWSGSKRCNKQTDIFSLPCFRKILEGL